MVSVGDCEHLARGRSQHLMRTSPMQNCSTEHAHSREAATGCRTRENSCRHRDKSHQLLVQTLHRSYDGVGRDVRLTTCVFGVKPKCQTSSTNYCADAALVLRGQVVVVVTVALR